MSSPDKLPRGWVKVKSKSHPNKVYYYNNFTKQSVWKLKDLISSEKSQPKQRNNDKMVKSPEKSQSRVSERSKTIGKKNLAEQRMKNLKMALELEKKEVDEKQQGKKPKEVQKSTEIITKKVPLCPRKRVEKKDPVAVPPTNVFEDMDVEMVSLSQEQQVKTNIPDESMEWEEIDEVEVLKEVLHVRSLKSSSSTLIPRGDESKMHDNKLLIVVDTNIFCSNLQFIDRIKGKLFKGEKNSVNCKI